MTAIARFSGLRAHIRRAARAVAATALAGAILLAGQPAVAATDDIEDTPAVVSLLLTPANSGIVHSGAAARATVTIANDTDASLDAAQLALEAAQTPLADDAALSSWLGTGAGTHEFTPIGSAETEAVSAGEQTSVEVFTDELATRVPGAYPLRARLVGTDAAITPEARSVLIVTAGQRPVSVVVPITLTPASGDLLSAEELEVATAPNGALTAVLDAVGGSAAALAVDPAIPAAIRALGNTAPPSAQTWLTQLESLPNDRFALQFADTDLTAQAQAGLPEPLGVTSLSTFLDPSDFTAPSNGTPSPAPSPSPTPTAADLPDLGELTGIRNALPGILWPRGGVDATHLATFASYFDADLTTILPSSSSSRAPGAVARADGHSVLLYDTAASAAFSQAIAESDAAARGAALTTAFARLALDDPNDPVLIALDRDETRTAVALGEVLDDVAAFGSPLRLTELREAAPAEVTIDAVGESSRAEVLPALLAEEQELAAFASILDDPSLLTERERIRLLRLFAVGEPAGGFGSALAAHQTRTTDTLNAVAIQPSSDVQILSAAVDLPVWVRNDLPWPVTVRLGAQPVDARLEVQAETIVESMAQNNTRVRVPVQARVASGEVDVRLRLTSATDVSIGNVEVMHVIVRAEWEGTGLIILGVAVSLLLFFGVVRTVRRRRRAAAAASGSDTGVS